MAAIQEKIVKKQERNRFSRVFHAASDKDEIAGWGRDLDRILLIFNVRPVGPLWYSPIEPPFQTEFSINNHMLLLDVRRGQGGADAQRQSVSLAFNPSTTKH